MTRYDNGSYDKSVVSFSIAVIIIYMINEQKKKLAFNFQAPVRDLKMCVL